MKIPNNEMLKMLILATILLFANGVQAHTWEGDNVSEDEFRGKVQEVWRVAQGLNYDDFVATMDSLEKQVTENGMTSDEVGIPQTRILEIKGRKRLFERLRNYGAALILIVLLVGMRFFVIHHIRRT